MAVRKKEKSLFLDPAKTKKTGIWLGNRCSGFWKRETKNFLLKPPTFLCFQRFVCGSVEALCPRQRFRALFNPQKLGGCCDLELIHISNFSIEGKTKAQQLELAKIEDRTPGISGCKHTSAHNMKSSKPSFCKHLRACALKPFSLHFFSPSFGLPVDTVTILTLGHLGRRKYS